MTLELARLTCSADTSKMNCLKTNTQPLESNSLQKPCISNQGALSRLSCGTPPVKRDLKPSHLRKFLLISFLKKALPQIDWCIDSLWHYKRTVVHERSQMDWRSQRTCRTRYRYNARWKQTWSVWATSLSTHGFTWICSWLCTTWKPLIHGDISNLRLACARLLWVPRAGDLHRIK